MQIFIVFIALSAASITMPTPAEFIQSNCREAPGSHCESIAVEIQTQEGELVSGRIHGVMGSQPEFVVVEDAAGAQRGVPATDVVELRYFTEDGREIVLRRP